jgi:WXG100 family type VII secretion target
MTQFTVTPQELLNAATYCTNSNSQIQVQVQRVVTYIDSLMASGYSGPCATQLSAVAEQWSVDASNLNNVLIDIASTLTTSANNYSGNEGDNTRNFIGVGSALPAGNF